MKKESNAFIQGEPDKFYVSKRIATEEFEHSSLFGKYQLTSVAYQIPQLQRFTDWYDSDNNCNTTSKDDYSMIDHILVSSGLYDNISNVGIYHGYKEYCGKYNSDHYPVIVEFDFGNDS